MRTDKRHWFAAGLTLWTLAAGGGVGLLTAAAARPDRPAAAPAVRPAVPGLSRNATGPTCVLCLHPRCPCSAATLDAFVGALATAGDVDAVVLFAVPPGAGVDWTDAALVTRTRAAGGLRVVIDEGGRRCAALGARTSGQAFVFDTADRLAFSGGITPGRGERGDAAGLTAMKEALLGRPTTDRAARAAVFGCALYRPPVLEAVQ